jgi:hypothetical protein
VRNDPPSPELDFPPNCLQMVENIDKKLIKTSDKSIVSTGSSHKFSAFGCSILPQKSSWGACETEYASLDDKYVGNRQ